MYELTRSQIFSITTEVQRAVENYAKLFWNEDVSLEEVVSILYKVIAHMEKLIQMLEQYQ